MNRPASFSFLVIIACAAGCGGDSSPVAVIGRYTLFERGFEKKTDLGPPPELEIKSEHEVNFAGRQGSVQHLGHRYKVTFSGINAGTFRAAGLGNKEENAVTFWLEPTSAGNVILYSDNQASFFLRK